MRTFTAIVEKCSDTGLYVGYVPGFPGAHSQADTLEALDLNLREVIEMLLEDGEPEPERKFVGTHNIVVGGDRRQAVCSVPAAPSLKRER